MTDFFQKSEVIIFLIGWAVSTIIAFVRLEGKTNANATATADYKISNAKELADLKASEISDLKNRETDNKSKIEVLNNRLGSVENMMVKDMADIKNLFVERFSELRVQISEMGYKRKEDNKT